MKQKRVYLAELEASRKDYQSVYKHHSKKKGKTVNDTYTVFPRYFVNICEGKTRDPDKFFPDRCDYNWYYTSGALDVANLADHEFVVTPDDTSNLRFMDMHNANFNYTLKVCLKPSEPIYCIKSYPVPHNDAWLAIRQKNKFSVILANYSNNEICGFLLFKKTSDVPYYDIELDTAMSSIYTLTADSFIEIIDMESNETIYEYREPCKIPDSTCFGQIRYLKSNTVAFTNGRDLILGDSRLSEFETFHLKQSKCDDICSFTCNTDYYIYVASKHHLIKYDLRKKDIVASYTHMLETEPYLINLIQKGDTDIVCLSNHSSKVLFYSKGESCTLPLELPTLKHTYNEMLTKEAVHIRRHLEERLASPTIGLKLVQDSGSAVNLLSMNSAGDIYQQRIDTSKTEVDPEKKLSEWIAALPKESLRMTVTGITDMSHIRLLLNKPINQEELTSLTKKEENDFLIEEPLYGPENPLGSHLEEIWLDRETGPADAIPEMDISKKVTDWLSVQYSDDELIK